MVHSSDRENIGKIYRTKPNLKTTLVPKKKKNPPKKKFANTTRPFGTYPSRGESGEAGRPWKAVHEVVQAAIEERCANFARQPKLFRASKHTVHTALGLSHFLVRTQNLASSLI